MIEIIFWVMNRVGSLTKHLIWVLAETFDPTYYFVTKVKFLFLFRDFRLNKRKLNIVESRLLFKFRKMNENETKA